MPNKYKFYDSDLFTVNKSEENYDKIVSNPDNISNEFIHLIGKTYMDLYPKNRGCMADFFEPHTNHPQAKKMLNCNLTDSYDRWMFLAKIYEELPDNNGKMARTIQHAFYLAFGVYTRTHYPHEELSNSKVRAELEGVCGNYFARQFHKQLSA